MTEIQTGIINLRNIEIEIHITGKEVMEDMMTTVIRNYLAQKEKNDVILKTNLLQTIKGISINLG